MSNVQLTPISELSCIQGPVLVLGASGTIDTPLRAAVGYRAPNGQVLALDGTPFDASGGPALGFMPLPWSEAQAEALILSRKSGSMDEAGLWRGATGLVEDLSEAIGPNRAMDRLASFLGLRQKDYRLPQGCRPELHELRALAAEWMSGELPAEAAIEAGRRIIDGTALAEEGSETNLPSTSHLTNHKEDHRP